MDLEEMRPTRPTPPRSERAPGPPPAAAGSSVGRVSSSHNANVRQASTAIVDSGIRSADIARGSAEARSNMTREARLYLLIPRPGWRLDLAGSLLANTSFATRLYGRPTSSECSVFGLVFRGTPVLLCEAPAQCKGVAAQQAKSETPSGAKLIFSLLVALAPRPITPLGDVTVPPHNLPEAKRAGPVTRN